MSVRAVPDTHPDDWRHDRAVALETEARVIAAALLELANCEEVFEADRDLKACSEIRQLAGLLRTKAAERAEHARELRTAGK